MNWVVFLSAYVLLLIRDVSTLYNTMAHWDKRCFIEDVPENSMITYTWQLNDYIDEANEFETKPSKSKIMMLSVEHVDKKTAKESVKLLKESREGEGKLHYFASDHGEYKFCFELLPLSDDEWEVLTARLHVSSDTHYQEEEDEAQNNLEETKKSIKTTLQKAVRQLQKIRSEQKYYREREFEFRALSYLTSVRVLWYGGVTALTVVSAGCFFMYSMKNFFLKKKLV